MPFNNKAIVCYGTFYIPLATGGYRLFPYYYGNGINVEYRINWYCDMMEKTNCCGSAEVWGAGGIDNAAIITDFIKQMNVSLVLFKSVGRSGLNNRYSGLPFSHFVEQINQAGKGIFHMTTTQVDDLDMLLHVKILDADKYRTWRDT